MKSSMQTFLIGVFIGALVVTGVWLIYLGSNENENAARDLDWVIEQGIMPLDGAIAGISINPELPDAKPKYFPQLVKDLANELEHKYFIPKGVTLAQWAIESSWGINELGAHNYLGHTFEAVIKYLKDTSWVWRADRIIKDGELAIGPQRRFSSYKNIRECFRVHGEYLTHSPLYAAAFKTPNPERFARAIAKRYNPNPQYAVTMIAIMRRYHLE
jgi:hypothetical protein